MQLPLYLFDPSRSAPDGRGEDGRHRPRNLLFALAPGTEKWVLTGLALVGPAARKRNLLAEQAAAGGARLVLARQIGAVGSLPCPVVVRVRAAARALGVRAGAERDGVELAGN